MQRSGGVASPSGQRPAAALRLASALPDSPFEPVQPLDGTRLSSLQADCCQPCKRHLYYSSTRDALHDGSLALLARKLMEIYVTRSSVAAGDDVFAPNQKTFLVRDGSSVEDVLSHIQREGYLPSIASGNACWSAASNVPIAVITQHDTSAKIIFHLSEWLDVRNGILRIHFNYHAQVDPDFVYEILRGFRCHAVDLGSA